MKKCSLLMNVSRIACSTTSMKHDDNIMSEKMMIYFIMSHTSYQQKDLI